VKNQAAFVQCGTQEQIEILQIIVTRVIQVRNQNNLALWQNQSILWLLLTTRLLQFSNKF